MNCEEAEELLGAYALDALPEGDASRLREHLRSCRKHDTALAELRSTASRLAATADAVAPPAALRARVLDAVARTPQDAAAVPVATRLPSARPVQRREREGAATVVPFPRRVQWAWAAVAAVLVAAVVGVGAWNVVLQRGSGDNVGALATRATSISTLKASGATGGGVVIYYAHDKKAVVVTEGVAQLDTSRQAYQMWAITDGHATSLGLMPSPVNGSTLAVVPFDASKEQQIAVSIEPPGGSAQPTTSPVFVADV
jgi:anti-sigma-K factor RskA